MIIYIGHAYLLDGKTLVHVQDTDGLNLVAKVGVVDENGLVPDTQWVAWERLFSPSNDKAQFLNEVK